MPVNLSRRYGAAGIFYQPSRSQKNRPKRRRKPHQYRVDRKAGSFYKKPPACRGLMLGVLFFFFFPPAALEAGYHEARYTVVFEPLFPDKKFTFGHVVALKCILKRYKVTSYRTDHDELFVRRPPDSLRRRKIHKGNDVSPQVSGGWQLLHGSTPSLFCPDYSRKQPRCILTPWLKRGAIESATPCPPAGRRWLCTGLTGRCSLPTCAGRSRWCQCWRPRSRAATSRMRTSLPAAGGRAKQAWRAFWRTRSGPVSRISTRWTPRATAG